MRLGRVLEAAVYAPDLDAAERFYGGVLGLPVAGRAAGRHVFFRCGPTMLLVFDPAGSRDSEAGVPPHGAAGPGHVAFAVAPEELSGWLSALRERGVEIERDHRWPDGNRSIYFRDPAGNSVEITTPAIWGISEP